MEQEPNKDYLILSGSCIPNEMKLEINSKFYWGSAWVF